MVYYYFRVRVGFSISATHELMQATCGRIMGYWLSCVIGAVLRRVLVFIMLCSAIFGANIWQTHVSSIHLGNFDHHSTTKPSATDISGITTSTETIYLHVALSFSLIARNKQQNVHNASNPNQILRLRPLNPQTNPNPHPPTHRQRIARRGWHRLRARLRSR